jgi:SAM-dependent methyltransferase
MIICPACNSDHDSVDLRCPACGCEPAVVDGFPAWSPSLANESEGFKQEYFADLAPKEAASFWFKARNDILIWALTKHFPQLRSFLEIGCGTGYVLKGVSQAFPEARMVGTEIFTAGLGYAVQRVPSATFMQMDARRIPYADEFDVVGAFDVLEHIEEDVEVIENLRRAVRPGGGIVITVPQHMWLWSQADDYACHARRYESSDLRRKLESAGLTTLYSTSFVSLLLPAMILSRKRATGNNQYDPTGELRINPMLNSLLGTMMDIERMALRGGVRFPLGGSLLIVAQRR